MPVILGIESTCDETGAAVVVDGCDVRANVVASQAELHARFRGVVPEIASRAHIQNILPVVREALETARCDFQEIDAIAVAHRPGLIGSLLVGVTAAKTLAWSLNKPLIGVDHVHAHLYSIQLAEKVECPPLKWGHSTFSGRARGGFDNKGDANLFPAVGLVVSGGHTALYEMNSWTDVTLVGSTIDDAVGEAYDKVASILGLGYPGGPIIDKLAENGDPKAIAFPRPLLGRDSLDFSFSGLKTAVLYHVRGVPGRVRAPHEQPGSIQDIAASFQAACVETIVEKIRRATVRTKAESVIIGGGVSANRGLRAAMTRLRPSHVFPAARILHRQRGHERRPGAHLP